MNAKEETPVAEKPKITDEELMFKTLLTENKDLEVEETGCFHWEIDNWKDLETKSYSPVFKLHGFEWRILLFSKGNNQKTPVSVSVYLEVTNVDQHEKGWHVCGQFALAISNPEDPTKYYSNSANHRFSEEEVDWGFTRFYDITELSQTTGKGPFLVNNRILLSCYLKVIRDETGVLWHNFLNYDSRKETGYVGIRNQGATCYMNSLLQSLYCTNSLRKAVYQIPTEQDDPTKSVALALQRCFYNLQFASDPVGTTELTKSFGWDSFEAFTQHDVQEFNRVLQDNLEEKMKGTPADGAISSLFEGKMKSYIKCKEVEFESSRVENYYDIQLNVKGCKDLKDSFDDYITVESLEGDNKYHAEGHGLQDAHKGVIFESFPPVLHLQLKRFEYDFMRDTMVKINDRHEFPEEINLDKYCSNSDQDGPYDYELHGVLVHSGDISGGHYFALIRPDIENKWYRFDDDRVTRATKKEVYEENYGDEPVRGSQDQHFGAPLMLNTNNRAQAARLMKRFTNAYMLVYIRKSKLNEILGQVKETDIPIHLKKRLDAERAMIEKRKQDRQDMQLNEKVAIVTDESFKQYNGYNLAAFDDRYMEVSEGVQVFKVPKVDQLNTFKSKLVESFGIPAENFRLWSMNYRQNKTIRVDHILNTVDEKQTIEKLKQTTSINPMSTSFIKIYMEIAENNKALPVIRNDQKIIFIKYFNVRTQEMRGIGHIFVSLNDKIASILSILVEKAGLTKSTSIQVFHETGPKVIQALKSDQTFRKLDIQHGDILCFQKTLNKKELDEFTKKEYKLNVLDYFNSLSNQTCILLKPKQNNQNGEEVKLILDKTVSYSTAAEALGNKIKVEGGKIKFTSSIHTKESFKPTTKIEDMITPLPKTGDLTSSGDLSQLTNVEHVPTHVLYYEVLDVDIIDLETKRSIEVILIGPTLRKETKITAIIPRTGSVQQLLDQIIIKSKLDLKDPAKIRLFEVSQGKVTKEFSLDQTVDNVATEKGSIVYAEPIPKDELDMNLDTDRLIQVVHYTNKPNMFHSIPFRFVAIKGEPFEETKKRLQKRTGLGDMDWKKVNFNILRNLNGEPQVSLIDQPDFDLRKAKLQEEDALGLDYVDKSSKSRFSNMFENGIFIRG